MPRASRNRILIASVVLLVGVLVTLNVVMLSALREKPAPPRQTFNQNQPVAVTSDDAGTPDVGESKDVERTSLLIVDVSPDVAVATASLDVSVLVAVDDAETGVTVAPETLVATPDEDALTVDTVDVAEAIDSEAENVRPTAPDAADVRGAPVEIELVGLPVGAVVTVNSNPTTALKDGRFRLMAALETDAPVVIEVNAKGYETWKKSIAFDALGKPVTTKLTARKKSVLLTTVPKDAKIRVGSRTYGTGHRFSISYDSSLSVRVERKGYDTRKVKLHYNSQATTVTLKAKAMGTLKTRIFPFSATIYIDGKKIRRAAPAFSQELPVGKHTLTAVGRSGEKVTKNFIIQANKTKTLEPFTAPD